MKRAEMQILLLPSAPLRVYIYWDALCYPSVEPGRCLQGDAMPFIERLSQRQTLLQAWKRVSSKRGMGGIDRVTVDAFADDLDRQLASLMDEILSARYRPLPFLRIRPTFLASSDRALVVPAVRDRVVLRAVADLLSPKIEPTLSVACRAFRKGSSATGAADDVGRWIEKGSRWVVRADVAGFFDNIQPQLLLDKLQAFIDPEGLAFLERLLRFDVLSQPPGALHPALCTRSLGRRRQTGVA